MSCYKAKKDMSISDPNNIFELIMLKTAIKSKHEI